MANPPKLGSLQHFTRNMASLFGAGGGAQYIPVAVGKQGPDGVTSTGYYNQSGDMIDPRNPNNALTTAEYNNAAATIGAAAGMPNYNPARDTIGPQDWATSTPQGLAQEDIAMNNIGNQANKIGLIGGLFGAEPNFENPSNVRITSGPNAGKVVPGSYGGSLVTGKLSDQDGGTGGQFPGIGGAIASLFAPKPTFQQRIDSEVAAGGPTGYDISSWYNDSGAVAGAPQSAFAGTQSNRTSNNNDGDATNDTGNAGWGFTSIADMFDGGGPGASGDSYTGGIHGNKTVGNTAAGSGSIVKDISTGKSDSTSDGNSNANGGK